MAPLSSDHDQLPLTQGQPKRPMKDLAKPLRLLVGGALIVIVCLSILQVFFRSVLGSALIWSEELAQLLLVWLVFIGSAVICWDGSHLHIDVLYQKIPRSVQKLVQYASAVIALAVAATLMLGAIPLISLNATVEMSALKIPLSWVRAAALIGGGLMVIFTLLRIYRRSRMLKKNAGGDNINRLASD